METFDRFAILANQLEQEDVEVAEAPIPWYARNTLQFTQGGYVCRDNGVGCGRAFPTREAKNKHRMWCRSLQ
jgi:hypothetical protein